MWEKIKFTLARFMQGRYGSDALGRFLVWAALILYVLGILIPSYVGGLFSFLGLAALIYTLFRMFSRNTARRSAENTWFWNKTAKLRTAVAPPTTRSTSRRRKAARSAAPRTRAKSIRGWKAN